MRKYITMLLGCLAMLLVTQVKSQSNFTGTTANPTSLISAATVDTAKYTISTSTGNIFTVSARAIRTTGTMAGTVRLYGAVKDTVGAYVPLGDTLTLTNAQSNVKYWTFSNSLSPMPAYKYLMILQSGGTTVTGRLYGTISVRN